MKLTGVNLINIALNQWLKKNGFKTRIRKIDTDFYWWWDNNTISYSLFLPEESIEQFDILLDELGCQHRLDSFYTAFLHEVGHSETYYELDDAVIDEDFAIKKWLSEQDESSFEESVHQIYFHLPMELVATKWAVDFINHNPAAVADLVRTVGSAVRTFYSLNDVVTEELLTL